MLAMFRSFLTQMFPPSPSFSEKDLPSQKGKVFIVTGGNQGIGLELIKMLYPTGATIYTWPADRGTGAEQAIQELTSQSPAPSTPSTVKFLHLDLNDLSGIKVTAAAFAAQEQKLDILWNNAGIGAQPAGTTTAQGLEGHIGINCVAPLLLTQLLLPQLRAAARSPDAVAGSVRVVWTGSLTVYTDAPSQGVDLALAEQGATQQPRREYAMSKAGNWFLAVEGARRWGGGDEDTDGRIVSVVQNPGNLYTTIYKSQSRLLMFFLAPMLYSQRMGAYTTIYAGFSPELTLRNNGAYIIPWGRVVECERRDISAAIRDGQAVKFWDWCEEKFRPYV